MKWTSLYKFSVTILSLLIILLLVLNAYYVWNWGDDYLIKHFYKERSPMKYLWDDYFIFDGRSLNPGYIISRICLGYDLPYLSTIFATILLLLSAVIFKMILNRSRQFEWKKEFVPTIVIATILWLSLFNSLNEILYWQTGMLYMVELFLIAWLYMLLVTGKQSTGIIIILAFLTGMSSPNAVIALLFVLILEYIKLRKENAILRQYKAAIIALSVGLLIVVLAPGSSVRWNMEGGADAKALSNVYEMYFRIQQMISAFIELNTVIVWFLIVGGITIVIGFSAGNTSKRFFDYLYDFRWILGAVFCIVFYFPKMAYYIQTSRLNSHFVFFSALFFYTQLRELKIRKPEIFQFQDINFKLPVLLLGLVMLFSQVLGSKHCVGKFKIREQIYSENKGKDVVLKANDIIGPPRTKFFTDVNEDSSHIFNQSIAEFYGLKSIRREKYR